MQGVCNSAISPIHHHAVDDAGSSAVNHLIPVRNSNPISKASRHLFNSNLIDENEVTPYSNEYTSFDDCQNY